MKLLKSSGFLKSFFTILFAIIFISRSAAQYIADSDISNSAGTNEGKDQLWMYVFIVSLLVLSVVIAYRKKQA
jgi:cbb3-type cytochrome oxidase subunit 3